MAGFNFRCIAFLSCASLFISGCSGERLRASSAAELGIKPGIYVEESQSCADPANAAILSFNGVGLNGAHSRDCRLSLQSNDENAYTYSQKCVGAGTGGAVVITEHGIINVYDDQRFSLSQDGGTRLYKHCKSQSLPPEITMPKNQ